MSESSHRRDRLRERTVAEIKQAARGQLVSGGPTAISLRAIARDMGMTAPALYRYFPALDALVIEMCTDLYNEIRIACERAAADIPVDQPVERLLTMVRAMRRWALEHRPEATLMFGPPLPGVEQFHQECLDMHHAGAVFGQTFLAPIAQLWRDGRLPPAEHIDLEKVAGALPAQGDLPVEVIAFFLNAWTRVYGVMAAELFGQLAWATVDTEPLFEAELTFFVANLRPPRDS